MGKALARRCRSSTCGSAEGIKDERRRENVAAFFDMMGCAVVLGPIVGSVVGTMTPVDTKLVLGLAAQPVETHIHGFCASRLNVVGDNAVGGAVVSLNGSCALCVPHDC